MSFFESGTIWENLVVDSSIGGKLRHFLKPFTSRRQNEEYIEYTAIIEKLYPRLRWVWYCLQDLEKQK